MESDDEFAWSREDEAELLAMEAQSQSPLIGGDESPSTLRAMESEDEFPFSQEDEAGLLALETQCPQNIPRESPSQGTLREIESDDDDFSFSQEDEAGLLALETQNKNIPREAPSPNPLREMESDDDDDFPFSREDEADLLALEKQITGKPQESVSDDDFDLSPQEEAELLALEAKITHKKRSAEGEDDPVSKKIAVRYPTKSVHAASVLERYFGMKNFHPKQEAVIARVLAGGSALVVFPTGGGKSLCFQLPALLFEEQDKLENAQCNGQHGITIVVAPLISLMKDQCDSLVRRGVKARTLDSDKSREEIAETYGMLQNGSLKLLYCAPERLNNADFMRRLKQVRGGVRMVAIDEAHCISEWGHAFRPDYLKLARFVEEICAERVICLTATATPKVQKEICGKFNIDSGGVFQTSLYRANLQILVEGGKSKEELHPRLFQFLRQNPGPTIIYATLQKQTKALAGELKTQGFNVEAFHAGRQSKTKTNVQDRFMNSDNMIIVATIAFGMGINKDNVRNIVHFNIPSSIESYSQEIGRAGRDGKLSKCIFYVCEDDLYLREVFARGNLPSKRSLRNLLEDIQTKTKGLPLRDELKVVHPAQMERFDIREVTIKHIYALLELSENFQFLRATTPRHNSTYVYKAGSKFEDVAKDTSAHGRIIKHWANELGESKYTVDPSGIAKALKSTGTQEVHLVKKLLAWHANSAIDIISGGNTSVYHIMKHLPSTPDGIDAIVDQLYSFMEAREEDALDRTEKVLDLVTSTGCYTRLLLEHFGDALPDNREKCGHCSWCLTNTAVARRDPPPVPFNTQAFRAVLKAVPARDDPQFLTRLAFGISSPRVTRALSAGAHGAFRSMANHRFEQLLRRFTEVCNAAASGASDGGASAAPPLRVKSNYKKLASPATKSAFRGRTSWGGRRW